MSGGPTDLEGRAGPGDDGLGLDVDEPVAPAGPDMNEESPERAIGPAESRPWNSLLQDGELLTERKILEDEGGAGSEEGAKAGNERAEEESHQISVRRASIQVREDLDAVRSSSAAMS